MNKRMCLQPVRFHPHFVTRETGRARADERVEHAEFAAFSFGQQPLHPLRRKARAVTKPPMDRQPQVIEKVGRVTHDL